VLVWKTNFDKSSYSEVLTSHRTRSRGEPAPPTIEHIPPRAVQSSTSHSKVTHTTHAFICVIFWSSEVFKEQSGS